MTTQHAPESPFPIGTIIADKYRVERHLGKGGMGIVVAARHIKLDEAVAIKLMLADDLGNPNSIERFLREARACVKLKNNEHIARVSDVDTLPSGLPYMVMELLEGRDLDKLLKDSGVLPIHDACSYLIQACRALSDAHQKGIIHRDLKPQNLFLTHRADGSPCVKVLDFGISKHTLVDESASIDLTRPSDILGSAYYMSPEQARSSRHVVPQSDIYSLGAVLYKLLTGRAPFPKKTMLEVYEALLIESPAPPSQFRKEIPRELENIILRCLDKQVENRFSGANELMAALAPFTVPGETTKVDDTDSDCITTLPRARMPKSASMHGTMPLGQKHSAPEGRVIPFQTQPLDAKSLHDALHGYLPPRVITRPPAPSQPQIYATTKETDDDATPRIGPRKVPTPAPLRDEVAKQPPASASAPSRNITPRIPMSTPTPLPALVNSNANNETIYVPSAAHLMTRTVFVPPAHSRAKDPDSLIRPWNSFPAPPEKSKTNWKVAAVAGGAIAVLLGLLVLKLLS